MLTARVQETLRKYHGMRPEEIAEAEGLQIVQVDDMPERFDDILFLSTIFVPSRLTPHERHWRIAHCLGHYFQHEGNQIWCQGHNITWRAKQEKQADEFAVPLIVHGVAADHPCSSVDRATAF